MNALAVGHSFVAEFKYLPTPRIRHGTQGRTNEAHVVQSPLTFNPLGQEPRTKVALRGSLHKKSTRVAAETTAVETLTNTGPKSHQIEWDAAEERTVEDDDGASMGSMAKSHTEGVCSCSGHFELRSSTDECHQHTYGCGSFVYPLRSQRSTIPLSLCERMRCRSLFLILRADGQLLAFWQLSGQARITLGKSDRLHPRSLL